VSRTEGNIMNRVHRIRRSLAVLAGALLALAGATPAFAIPLPPPGGSDGSTAHAPVQVITEGGMPGWQIALIALGAALVTAIAAVLLDRARLARRVTATAS
jgi:ABC-type enterobactin transport system permease subunit